MSGARKVKPRFRKPLAATIALAVAGVLGADLAAAARPRVGLVLSGGGARGIAHLGVLEVLDEMRIPIDCIAGTSMGALVGGAYAAGVPIPEMEQVLSKTDWPDLFTDDPPRTERPYRNKRDDFANLFRFELGERDGSLLLPPGTTSGYKMEFLFRKMVARAGNFPDQDFDQLPIPFRVVATNLENGTKTVFARGDLVKALRASMSVPGALSPVEIDGVLHVDGGLVDNLPVDEARKACAEVVIAVNLGSPLLKREQMGSVIGVALQSINLLTEQNVRASIASLRPGDILLEPQLGAFSATDFPAAMTTIPIGEASARVKQEELARLSVSPEEYAAWKETLAARIRIPSPVTGVTVAKGPGRVNPEAIALELSEQPGIDVRKRPETDFSLDNLHRRLVEIYGRGDYDRMDYRIIDGPGVRTIEVQGIEKSWGPHFVKFGLGLAGDGRQSRISLAASHRMTWLNSLGGEWRNEVQLGYNDVLRSEFYQPLATRAGAFVAPSVEYRNRAITFFLDHRRIGEYRVTFERAHLDLGIQNKYGEIRAGAFGGGLRAREDFGALTGVPNFDLTQVGYQAHIVLDQLDSVQFPRDGYLAVLRTFGTVKGWGSDDEYNKTDLLLLGAKSFGRHALQVAGYMGRTLSGSLPPYDPFLLGGFLRGSGLLMDEITGRQVDLLRLVYTYRLAQLPTPLGRGIYLGASLEGVRGRIGQVEDESTLPAAGLFIGADTVIGPVLLGIGSTLRGDRTTRVYGVIGLQ